MECITGVTLCCLKIYRLAAAERRFEHNSATARYCAAIEVSSGPNPSLSLQSSACTAPDSGRCVPARDPPPGGHFAEKALSKAFRRRPDVRRVLQHLGVIPVKC